MYKRQVLGDGIIDRDVALMGLKRMDVDALGLDELDRSMLRAIIEDVYKRQGVRA